MYIVLSNSDPAPLYEQIEKQVIEQILKGRLEPGSSLPSIRSLAKELEISVITVKKAYEDLEAAGYIVTRAGKGSFVAEAGTEFVRESRLKEIQEHFEAGISGCRRLGMKDGEIEGIFKLLLAETEG